MIAASRPSGRFAVCCGEALRLGVRICASWCVLCGMVWRSRGADRGCRRAWEHGVVCVSQRSVCAEVQSRSALRDGRLACGGQALSLRGARPFQREERRWGVKQQVRSVSHDTARLNPAASSPDTSMTPPSCRTLVEITKAVHLNLAGEPPSRLSPAHCITG